jgi:NAD+ kinase
MLSSWLNGKRMEDALNDVFIRNWDHRVLDFDVRCDGTHAKFMADGVLFSTPTGSSAYAYSAGGKQLAPTAKKYEIVGLAPYRRTFKPLVVADKETSKLIVKTKRPAFAVIDGQFSHRLQIGSNTLVVKKSKKSVPLLWWQ